MWLKQLNIAIVEKDTAKISALMEDLPELTKKEDIDSALCLLEEATNLVINLKNETQSSMIQMKKNIKFLKATESQKPSNIDIKS